MPRVAVVAGILRDARGRVLIAERPADSALGGYWEFPGGKVRRGETAAAALCRELREELGIEVLACEPFSTVAHDYPDRAVRVRFFRVSRWRHEPASREGQALRWCDPADIDPDRLLPANATILTALCRRAPARLLSRD